MGKGGRTEVRDAAARASDRRVGRRASRALDIVHRDAAAWGMTRRVATGIAAAPVVGLLLIVATMRHVPLFDWLTRENSLLESGQVVALVAATVLFLLVALHFRRAREHLLAAVYLVLAAGSFFVAGEEISWGDHIFEWEGGDWLTRRNFQEETNLHNTGTGHRLTIYGFILLALYGTVAPLVVRGRERGRALGPHLLVPPLVLVPAFVIPFVYRVVRTAFYPHLRFPRYALQLVEFAEYAEVSLYFGLVVFAFLTWALCVRRRGRDRATAVSSP